MFCNVYVGVIGAETVAGHHGQDAGVASVSGNFPWSARVMEAMGRDSERAKAPKERCSRHECGPAVHELVMSLTTVVSLLLFYHRTRRINS